MKKAFVTGGSGFVGQNLLRQLCLHGYEVKALARSDKSVDAVKAAGAIAVKGDLDSRAELTAGMKDCDTVFHLASMVEHWGDAQEFYKVNVDGTENVLEAARINKTEKFIYLSTSLVLSKGQPLINARETWPKPERPAGIYPLTKSIAEEKVLAANSAEFQTIIIRPPTIWGKGDPTFLPQVIKSIKDRFFMWVDNGEHLISTCHVLNICKGTILAAEKGKGGDIFFFTDGRQVTFHKFIGDLLETQGITPSELSIPYWIAKGGASGVELIWNLLKIKDSPPVTRSIISFMGGEFTLNDAKARKELDYTEAISYEAGIAEMVKDKNK